MGFYPYFPEKYLCDWYKEVEGDESVAVYTMTRTGVKPFVTAMREVIKVSAFIFAYFLSPM